MNSVLIIFINKGKNIYRVMRGFDAKVKRECPYLSGPYAPALLNDFQGEIKKAVRVMPSNDLISFGNNSFNEKKIYMTDADFFSLFSFPLIKRRCSNCFKRSGQCCAYRNNRKKIFWQHRKCDGQSS